MEDNCNINGQLMSISDAAIIRKYDLMGHTAIQEEHNYTDIPVISSISQYKKAAISYISGYVVKMAEKRLKCIECCHALKQQDHGIEDSFLKFKDRGGLIKATPSVIIVCEETEKCFQRLLKLLKGNLPQEAGIPDAIAMAVLRSVNLKKVFTVLEQHMLDLPVMDNHIFSLVKLVSRCYCTIRLHHLGKEFNTKTSDKKVRKQLTKLVLFKHQ